MPDYALTGKKGTGKSKNAILIIRDQYLAKGFKVATNLDIYLSPMFGPYSKQTYVRLPDKPTAFDLEAAGHGNPDNYNEDLNGALVLDEMGTWLNTRTFGDKDRGAMLDFLAHGRKFGWNGYYIMQNVAQVDKQLRESFIEFTVRHTRFDKVKIPFIGGLLCALFGDKAGYLPRFHRAITRLGHNPQDLVTDTAMFKGDDLHKCYDTRQVFRPDYQHGTFSALSPWHLEGRFMPEQPKHWSQKLAAWWRSRHDKPKPCNPITRPAPELVRVLDMARKLPPDEAFKLVARYNKKADSQLRGKQSDRSSPALPG